MVRQASRLTVGCPDWASFVAQQRLLFRTNAKQPCHDAVPLHSIIDHTESALISSLPTTATVIRGSLLTGVNLFSLLSR